MTHEQGPSDSFQPPAQGATDALLTPEIVGNLLSKHLEGAYDALHDLDLGRVTDTEVDIALGESLDDVMKNTDTSTPEGMVELGIASAVYQGGTRSPERQSFNGGHQPFSDMLERNTTISDRTRKTLGAIMHNKAAMMGNVTPGDDQERSQVVQDMQQVYRRLAGMVEEPNLSDADRTALGFGLALAAAASAESWNRQSFNYIIQNEITPLLTVQQA